MSLLRRFGLFVVVFVIVSASNQVFSASSSKNSYSIFLPVLQSPLLPAEWEQIEFASFNVTDIVYHPIEHNQIYVSTFFGGLFESQDNGENWELNWGGGRIHDIEIRQSNPDEMYLATISSWGIFQSKDGGTTWNPTEGWSNLFPGEYSVATDPNNDSMLLAGASNWEFNGGQIFKSNNNGGVWFPVSGEYENIRKFIFNPSNTEIVYAHNSYVVKKSNNSGDGWYKADAGLPAPLDYEIFDMVQHPVNSESLYLATSNGIYITLNGAETWESLTVQEPITALLLSSNEDDFIIYAAFDDGLMSSSDGGVSWVAYTNCGQSVIVNQIVEDPNNSFILWIGTNNGLWRCDINPI